MTGGRYVSADECERIRGWRRQGYTYRTIREVFLDDELSQGGLEYHARGQCAHGGEPVARTPRSERNSDPDIPALEDAR